MLDHTSVKNSLFGCVKSPGLRYRKRVCIDLILTLLRYLNRGRFHASQKGYFSPTCGLKFFAVFSLTLAFADQVHVLPSGPSSDPNYYQQILGEESKAVVIGLKDLGESFKKDKSWWGKLLKKNDAAIPLSPDVRKIVCMNIPNHFYRDYRPRCLPKEKMVLFMWEPYIRLRKMYNQNLRDCFSKIYTWDDGLVDGVKYFKFYYPVLRPMISELVPFEEKKFCTLVTGYVNDPDKYPGEYPNELYSERLKAQEFFEKVGEEGFEVYGRGWEKAPATKSFRGACRDKIQVIKNYRFSICYENCQGEKGYISEKIFDCFAAGNVPVYWGASNVTDYIPKDCFIDRRDFATLDDLYLFLKSMTKETYEGYLAHIRDYLASDAAQVFSEARFEEIFRDAVR